MEQNDKEMWSKAIGELAKSNSTKTIILPTDVTKILGTLETFLSMKSKK